MWVGGDREAICASRKYILLYKKGIKKVRNKSMDTTLDKTAIEY